MANMMDYLDWRGDLSWLASEFNEVDNLILAELVYVDLDGVVPGMDSHESISLWKASEEYFKLHTEKEILDRASSTKAAVFVMKKMAETQRFRNMQLFYYVNDISLEEQSQFSAMCIDLGNGAFYIAYRGTDNTIVGWREDFNMSYLSKTPGQIKAVEYLNQVARGWNQIYLGGHSKGGNLSVYAAVECLPEIQEHILAIYSNDGPGFGKDFVQSPHYMAMIPKIHTYLPESSVIGMILEHEENYDVVKSSNTGIRQHDAMSWETLGTSFCRAKSLDKQSLLINETFKTWLSQLTGAQREEIVDSLFSMLDSADILTIDDFYNSPWKKIQGLLKARSELTEETQQLFSQAMSMLWKAGNDTLKATRLEEKKNTFKLAGKTLQIADKKKTGKTVKVLPQIEKKRTKE